MQNEAGQSAVTGVRDDWPRTRAWVLDHLPPGTRVNAVEPLRGGWTSRMRRLRVQDADCEPYDVVLRSFVKPFFVRHAPGLLTREADVLQLLAPTSVPAARLIAVDATGEHGEHPSLLMSCLPGTLRLDPPDADRVSELLARQLTSIHALSIPEAARPRPYQAWTGPERVTLPAAPRRPAVWQRAVDVIRRPPPPHQPCFLHRDFHPGNVLFTEAEAEADADAGADAEPGLSLSGVVDWVETSWGPADLDVAHCSTALALLHGVPTGMRFADLCTAAGGTLATAPADHLYWRLLDALAFAPDAEKVATPWRESGRADLTPDTLTQRLEDYIEALLTTYG